MSDQFSCPLSNDEPNIHWFETASYSVKVRRSQVVERLLVRGLLVSGHVIHDMETKTLVMELRRFAVKTWIP